MANQITNYCHIVWYGDDKSMENHIRRKKEVRMNCIQSCRGRIVYWPPIKVSSAFIGCTPINIPEDSVIPPVVGSIIPTVNRYFYIPASNINLTTGATIPSKLFYKDNGNPTTEFIIFSPNGYVNLYINGVMQNGGLYSLNANSLIINPTAGTIRAGTSIIIESLGFSSE
jgi:hypothetical protein